MALLEWSESAPGRKYLKQRRGSTWYVFKSADDKWSLKTKDYDEACRLYDSTDLNEERPADGSIRCKDAWKVFIGEHPLSPATVDRWDGIWRNWASKRLGNLRVAEVRPHHITRVYKDMEEAETPVQHANAHRALSSFFATCTTGETNYRPDNPVAKVGKRWIPVFESSPVDEEAVVISDAKIEEMAGLAEVAGNPLRRDERMGAIQLAAIVRLQPLLGCRINELLGTKLTDLKVARTGTQRFDEWHFERQIAFDGEAEVEETWFANLKGKKGTIGTARRAVSVSEDADEIVSAYIDLGSSEGWLKPGGLLFPNAEGRPRHKGHVISKVTALHKLVGNGVTGTHCFRHTAVSNWLASGMPIERAAYLIGDGIETTRKVYGHLVDRDKTNAENRAWMGRRERSVSTHQVPKAAEKVTVLALSRGK